MGSESGMVSRLILSRGALYLLFAVCGMLLFVRKWRNLFLMVNIFSILGALFSRKSN
jgi:hypothetical protein